MHASGLRELWPVAIAILVRVSVWLLLPHTRFASDEDSYYRVGTAFLATGEQDLFWPPVTGWLIAFAAAVLNTTDLRWLRLVWIVMDIGCVLAVRTLGSRTAERLLPDMDRRSFVNAVTLGYGLYLPAISFAQFTTSEVPALLLLLLALVVMTRRGDSTASAVVTGLMTGLLSITRPSLVPIAIFLPGAALVAERTRRATRLAIVAVLTAGMVIAGVVLRNLARTGEATIARNSAYNFYVGNRDLYAEDLDLLHPVATAGQIEFRRQFWSGELDYPTQSAEQLQREAFAWIAAHPGQFVRRAFGRLARVFAPKTDVLELLGGERQAGVFSPASLTLLGIANLQWLVVLFGGLVGLVGMYRLRKPWGAIFAATILGSLPLCLIAISKPRYAFTFEPILLIAAVFLTFARAEVLGALTRRDRWIVGACAGFLLWGWVAWLVFAVTSRVGLASAP